MFCLTLEAPSLDDRLHRLLAERHIGRVREENIVPKWPGDSALRASHPKYYYTDARPFWDTLVAEITKTNTIYQWRRQYVRQNKSGVSPTLTANMGMGGHNVPLIKTRYGIRKLTPRECFNLMGFDDDFVLPETLAQSQLYKQAGNSVVVPVIQRIATQVLAAISDQ
jgi:DNA (cytosine-5)-methyltransferase 1